MGPLKSVKRNADSKWDEFRGSLKIVFKIKKFITIFVVN